MSGYELAKAQAERLKSKRVPNKIPVAYTVPEYDEPVIVPPVSRQQIRYAERTQNKLDRRVYTQPAKSGIDTIYSILPNTVSKSQFKKAYKRISKDELRYSQLAENYKRDEAELLAVNEPYIVNGKLTLPDEIWILGDKQFANRYIRVAELYGMDTVLEVLKISNGKNIYKPKGYFRTSMSVDMFLSKTLPILLKAKEAIKTATLAMDKLGISSDWLRYYTGVAMRTSEAKFAGILEQALNSAKTSPQNYFKYLSTQV